MRRHFAYLTLAVIASSTASYATAQPPRFGADGPERAAFGPPGPPMGNRDGMLRRSPLMLALDSDDDGELSSEELASSVAALSQLDQNNDGKLTADELRPKFDGRRENGDGGQGQRGPAGRGGGRRGEAGRVEGGRGPDHPGTKQAGRGRGAGGPSARPERE